jgi:hypothetical protein
VYGFHEPRHFASLKITIRGRDRNGNRFKQTARTRDVSRKGARISGIPLLLERASLIEIAHRRRLARFRVIWIGNPDAAPSPEAGIQFVEGDSRVWGEPLPGKPKLPAQRAF